MSLRLDASPRKAARVKGGCKECSAPFASEKAHAEFCSPICRRAWNNRRATRGVEIYDLFMALRYDRDRAKLLKLWNLLCRLAAAFREDDLRERAGRPSWADPRAVLERKPHLAATIVHKVRRRTPQTAENP